MKRYLYWKTDDFRSDAFGASRRYCGIVFSTAMTGYWKVEDLSYTGNGSTNLPPYWKFGVMPGGCGNEKISVSAYIVKICLTRPTFEAA